MDKNYYFRIMQCVSGRWVLLTEFGIEGKLSPEQASETLDEFTRKLFDSGKMFVTKKTESTVFNADKWPITVFLKEGTCDE